MSNGPKKPTPSGPSLDQLLMASMRGNQAIQSAADTSDVQNRVMQERQQRFDRDVLERQRRDLKKLQHQRELKGDFQKRFDALYEKRRQENLTARQEPKQVQQGALRARQEPKQAQQGALMAGQQPTTVRSPPKPITKKFSTKIPVSKTTTLEPVRMGEGFGGGLKATVKFK